MHAKFIVNNFSSQPILQCETMVTTKFNGGSVSEVTNGMLTNGKVMLPVSGIVKRYKDGRIEVNGELIDWNSIANQRVPQQLVLPQAMHDEPAVKQDEKPCIICEERSIKTTLVECGHQVYCVTCSLACVKQGTLCPVCRTPIAKVIRIYEV